MKVLGTEVKKIELPIFLRIGMLKHIAANPSRPGASGRTPSDKRKHFLNCHRLGSCISSLSRLIFNLRNDLMEEPTSNGSAIFLYRQVISISY
jgi:hypothetical protein